MGDELSSNENRKMKAADWQGYVRRSLEIIDEQIKESNGNMEKGFDELKKEIKETKKEKTEEVKDINNRMNFLYFKVGGIGASAGIVVSLLINFIFYFLMK